MPPTGDDEPRAALGLGVTVDQFEPREGRLALIEIGGDQLGHAVAQTLQLGQARWIHRDRPELNSLQPSRRILRISQPLAGAQTERGHEIE